jgi:glyoxylase I family protein
MRIVVMSVMVDNQDKALRFYTEVLGFAQGKDFDVGNGFRWITVISPEGHPDVELALEPNAVVFAACRDA